ncbi:hypothetical protein REPUB_Repub03eG0117100 [Reevesia pubescens]
MSIDVGRIILEGILKAIQNQSKGLYFPSFITGLCRKVGVRWSSNEELQHPKHVINMTIVKTFNIKSSTITAGASSSTLQIPRPAPLRPLTQVNILAHLEKSLEDHRQEFRQFGQWSERFVQYQENTNVVLAQMIANVTSGFGGPPTNVLQMPIYHPQSQSDEEGSDPDDEDHLCGDDNINLSRKSPRLLPK